MNTVSIRFGTDGLDWTAVLQLLDGKPAKDPESPRHKLACTRVATAFEKSFLVCRAHQGVDLVGIGRALSDGVWQSVLYDINVHPAFRRQGIGSTIVTSLLDRLPHGPTILYAMPGRESFYQPLGFHPLRTAMARFPDTDQRRVDGFID
jgi:aralkylamine N-acetyltransferase